MLAYAFSFTFLITYHSLSLFQFQFRGHLNDGADEDVVRVCCLVWSFTRRGEQTADLFEKLQSPCKLPSNRESL